MKTRIIALIASLITAATINAQVLPFLDDYGTEGDDRSHNLALDDEGNIYVTGTFKSESIDFGGIILENSSLGATYDVFIVKFEADGTPAWAVGSNSINANDFGNDIVVGEQYVYVIGSYENGPMSFDGGSVLSHAGNSDLFVACFKKEDGTHVWSFSNDDVTATADLNEYGEGIALNDNLLYLVGSFNSEELWVDGHHMVNHGTTTGTYDAYVSVLDVSGGLYSISWLKNPDGKLDDYGLDICVDADNNAFVTGYFFSEMLEFPAGTTLINTDTEGETADIFIGKFNEFGSYSWTENPIGDGDDLALGIETDGDVLYVTGGFKSSALHFGGTGGSLLNLRPMYTDYFLTKYDVGSEEAEWAVSANAGVYSSWNFDDYGKDIAIDDEGYVYVIGWFNSFQIDFGLGSIDNITNNNYSETIIAKYQDDGAIYWIESGHGIYNDRGMGVEVVDGEGSCIITGWYQSEPFEFGSYGLPLANPVEISDFYVGEVAGYNCQAECESPAKNINTGVFGIGEEDTWWTIVEDPSGGTVPRNAIGCVWNTTSWNYGHPFDGTNWISINDYPTADLGIYAFENVFAMQDTCPEPALYLCVMADDSVEVFLNGVSIGSGGSLSTPLHLSVTDPGLFMPVNTLRVEVHNTISGMMAFNLKGWICCEDIYTGFESESMITPENEAVIYPNPVLSQFNIETAMPMEEVLVYDLTGQLVRSVKCSGETTSLDVSDLHSGMYLVMIRQANGRMISKKLMKE